MNHWSLMRSHDGKEIVHWQRNAFAQWRKAPVGRLTMEGELGRHDYLSIFMSHRRTNSLNWEVRGTDRTDRS
ncbi:MAG: hypothetical protein ACRDWB_04470, partial [Acidimicrobiales bacterium]